MLDKLRQEINISINDFLSLIRKEYRLDLVNPILYESIREFSLRPGKRIRPLLLLLSYLGYSVIILTTTYTKIDFLPCLM